LKMEIIDDIISEPLGGAHRDYEKTSETIKGTILKNLKQLKGLKKEELLKLRYHKFRNMGVVG